MRRKIIDVVKYVDPRPLVERSMHQPRDGGHERAVRRTVTVNLCDFPLSSLHTRGHLTDRQPLAGEKLRGHYKEAAMAPNVDARWENIPLSHRKRSAPSDLNQTERTISAKRFFDDPLDALRPDLAGIA